MVKNVDAWHDFGDIANKFVSFGCYLKARKFLKLNLGMTGISIRLALQRTLHDAGTMTPVK
jgi:hypothetical protein